MIDTSLQRYTGDIAERKRGQARALRPVLRKHFILSGRQRDQECPGRLHRVAESVGRVVGVVVTDIGQRSRAVHDRPRGVLDLHAHQSAVGDVGVVGDDDRGHENQKLAGALHDRPDYWPVRGEIAIRRRCRVGTRVDLVTVERITQAVNRVDVIAGVRPDDAPGDEPGLRSAGVDDHDSDARPGHVRRRLGHAEYRDVDDVGPADLDDVGAGRLVVGDDRSLAPRDGIGHQDPPPVLTERSRMVAPMVSFAPRPMSIESMTWVSTPAWSSYDTSTLSPTSNAGLGTADRSTE